MYLFSGVSMCAFVEARGGCQLSCSTIPCLIPLKQGLSRKLGLGWWPIGHNNPLVSAPQPWGYRSARIWTLTHRASLQPPYQGFWNYFCFVLGWSWIFCVAKDDLEFLILLTPSHKCWNYRYVPPDLAEPGLCVCFFCFSLRQGLSLNPGPAIAWLG